MNQPYQLNQKDINRKSLSLSFTIYRIATFSYFQWILKKRRHLKLSINRSEDGNSEDNHEDQREDCEADIDLEHVEDEDGKLEEVTDDVRNFPGYNVHNNHRAHRTLQKNNVSKLKTKSIPDYLNVTNCSGVKEGHLLAKSVAKEIGSHPEIRCQTD